MTKCPVCGMMVNEKSAPSSEYEGKKYYFMSPAHKATFDKDPEKFVGSMEGHGDHEHHK